LQTFARWAQNSAWEFLDLICKALNTEFAQQSTMRLPPTIADISHRLRQGLFANEQAISQGIVLRVLHDLGWESWDTTVVWPEYQTGEGRADFALCHPPTKPAVFIEVKPPGKAEDGVRQALDYAFHSGGVPFVVLTDGKTWSFYLTMEQGSYEERRVFKLDLFERSPEEATSVLERYLRRDKVLSGAALENARTEYRSRNRKAQARAVIPEAWKELVEKGDELLVDLLTDAVESKSGIRPDADDVVEYLTSLLKPVILQPTSSTTRQPPRQIPAAQATPPSTPSRPSPIDNVSTSSRSGTLVLQGKAHRYNNAIEALVLILRELSVIDPTFLQRCAQHPDVQGRLRKYLGRTPEELYPHREDLRDMVEALPGGWLVATNLNNLTKKNIIKAAADVAGLRYGRDVSVEF
jgi:predicted type IV restriction endonuclease